MIRGTRNESISCIAKDKTTNPGANYTGTLSEGYETVGNGGAAGVAVEAREAFTADTSTVSTLPSSAFNGTYE